MRIRFYFFYSVLFLLFPFMLCGQQLTDTLTLPNQTLTVKDGLSQGMISGILQDKEGLMWFGTKEGLNKYDGYHFTVYKHEQGNPYSLPDNYVTGIIEDDNGNFWVGTNSKGLYLFDKKNEKFYPVTLSTQKDTSEVTSATPLKYEQGKLLVYTSLNIVYDVSDIKSGNYKSVELDKTKIRWDECNLYPEAIQPNDAVGSVRLYLHQNRMWAIHGTSIFEYKTSESGFYNLEKDYSSFELGFTDSIIQCMSFIESKNQYIIVGSYELMLYDFDNEKLIKKVSYSNNRYNKGRGVIKDNTGNYFITAALVPWQYFNISNYTLQTIAGRWGYCGCVDRNGILWMGTAGMGLIVSDFRKSLFIPVPQKNQGPLKYNGSGELVTLVENEPCFYNLYSKEEKPIFQKNAWDKTWNIDEFATDKRGTHWIIFDKQAKSWHLREYNSSQNLMRTKQLEHFDFHNQMKMIFDNENNLWINAFDKNGFPKLIKWNKEKFAIDTIYNIPATCQYFFGYFISSCHQDANNIFWFATTQGLYSFNPNAINKKDTWHRWNNIPNNKNSLPYDYLLTILPDPKQPQRYLWLGSDGGGLSRFDKVTNQFVNYTEKEGLPNNVVYSILSDNAGNLWMSTNRGLSCLNAEQVKISFTKDLKNLSFNNFTSDDGLLGDEFNRHEYFKMPDGDLFFRGVDGGTLFNPEKVLEKEAAPAIVFTGLSVYNKPVSFQTDSNIIQLPIAYAQTITLPHDKGMFTISFAALEYRAASKKHYKYFLEGYDKNWIESGNKNEATYTNLSPGTYTFHVTGAGSSGVWNTKEASIKIIVLPVWWQMWWFRLLVAAAVAAGAYALYRYRLRKALELQKIRNRIASDLHDEIGSTLSSISISSSIIQNKMKGSDSDVGGLLNQISNNTDSMMEAMSDIVWTINTKNDRFTNIINRMRAFAIEILEPKNSMVHFNANKIPDDIKLDMVQRKNLYLIFKEAINNAAKYSECKNVWIHISLTGNKKLVMKIKDDGKGFTPHNGLGANEFGGNGLTNMHKRASELSGKLKIDAAIEKGVEVSLEFMIRG
ncbi:MAG: two-component regulator propeller domain-containing protein [Bacteroidia bacterium]